MHKFGILTGADLRDEHLTFLVEHFGSSAERYHAIARGIDDRPVRPDRVRKSVGAENTFAEDITELEVASAQLEPIIAKVVTRCAEKEVNRRVKRGQIAA